jgi:hypothetical protein
MNVNAIALILLAMTLALVARVWVPWGERASGNLVGVETLSVLGRLRMHGPSVSLVFAVSLVLLALGKISSLTLLLVTALLVLLLALPVRYTMTSRGIRAAWTPFRRWTEFGGWPGVPAVCDCKGSPVPGRSRSGSPAVAMTTNSSSCCVSLCVAPTRGAWDLRLVFRSPKLLPLPDRAPSASPAPEAIDRRAQARLGLVRPTVESSP